ncbi:hypothetical protein SDC9_197163 [bioreactor metagenome]|uniref:Uncharacterized protein n=1 Tax=bioreactor metagenome TaxID=1076179 RepID=A0A645IFD2_9ZZZZ
MVPGDGKGGGQVARLGLQRLLSSGGGVVTAYSVTQQVVLKFHGEFSYVVKHSDIEGLIPCAERSAELLSQICCTL